MPMFPPNLYIENPTNGRLYEVTETEGYPHDDRGDEVRCHINHLLQRIEFSDSVPACERALLLARAFGHHVIHQGWRLVPVVGRVT